MGRSPTDPAAASCQLPKSLSLRHDDTRHLRYRELHRHALTVNDIVARYPSTLPVFNAFGIDTCCGGGLAVTEAAARHGIPLNALRSALESAIDSRFK